MTYWKDCLGYSGKDRFLLKGENLEMYFDTYKQLYTYCTTNNINAKQV